MKLEDIPPIAWGAPVILIIAPFIRTCRSSGVDAAASRTGDTLSSLLNIMLVLGAIAAVIGLIIWLATRSGSKSSPGSSIIYPDTPKNNLESKPEEVSSPAVEVPDAFYYLDAKNNPVGPLSFSVLQQLHRSGAITDDTLAARENTEGWQPLSNLLT